ALITATTKGETKDTAFMEMKKAKAVISASEPLSSALLSVLFLGLVVDWSPKKSRKSSSSQKIWTKEKKSKEKSMTFWTFSVS
ncbi:hypothetical protein RIT80_11450, partial [Streptococcus pneumoniae]|nr:hypothetical protein [Streptococcus pneumoniae]